MAPSEPAFGRAVHRWLSGGADPAASSSTGGQVYDIKADNNRYKRAWSRHAAVPPARRGGWKGGRRSRCQLCHGHRVMP